jgi:hypothetical protein
MYNLISIVYNDSIKWGGYELITIPETDLQIPKRYLDAVIRNTSDLAPHYRIPYIEECVIVLFEINDMKENEVEFDIAKKFILFAWRDSKPPSTEV